MSNFAIKETADMSKSEYIKKNQKWLQEKSLEEGVEHLEGQQITLIKIQ